MSRRRGFTFVELSVVLIVIVLGSVIVAPRALAMIDGQRVNSFRQDVQRLFRQAKTEAQSRRTDLVLRWEDGLVLEQAAAEEGGEANVLARAEAPEGLVEFERATVGASEEDSSNWQLQFPSIGQPEQGGIQLSASGRPFWVRIGPGGVIEFGDDELPPSEDTQEWPAGDLEIRGGGE